MSNPNPNPRRTGQDERKPLLASDEPGCCESGELTVSSAGARPAAASQQHLIIQPVEFDHKHRNQYGYLALAAAVLVLASYLMIKERSCLVSFVNGAQNFELIQSFHMLSLIVAIIVFVLSYFNFAIVLADYKLVFLATAALIFACSGLLAYDMAAIVSAPCVPVANSTGLLRIFDASAKDGHRNIFDAQDSIGIAVFLLDLLAACVMFLAGRQFYKRR